MRDLAKIGVLGHQLDVAEGGDVDPATGRLLSIAELQQALRAVRRGPAVPSMPVDHLAPPEDPREERAPSGGLTERSPEAARPDPDDSDEFDDLGGWLAEEHTETAVPPARTARRSPVKRPWGRWTGWPGSARRRAERSARKHNPTDQSGTDEAPRGRGRVSRPAVQRRPDPQWLANTDDGGAGEASFPADLGVAPVGCPAGGPDAAGTAAPPRAATLEDVQVSAAPRGFMTVLWLWVARVAVALVFFAGVNQVFVKPFRSTAVATSALASVNTFAAQQAAARYVSDYLNYQPGRGAAQSAAVQSDLVPAAGGTAALWSGTGYLRPTSVLAGQVVTIDPAHALVSVAAQIQLAMPTTTQDKATSPGPATAVPGADPGPVPTGWTDRGTVWVQLSVPVQSSGAAVKVSAGGGVFCGEIPQQVTAFTGAQVDNAVTTSTQAVATSLLSAYASSNVAYLAAPGVSLSGLAGAVTLVSLTGWSVALPTAAAGFGTGTGLVTWQLTGTDLQIVQPYTISLTDSQNRWYGAAVGPDNSAP